MSVAALSRRPRPANRIKPSADAYVARMLADVNVYLNWLTTNGLKGYIGEFGWPAYDDGVGFARFAEALYDALVGGPDVWLTAWLVSENFPNHDLAAYRGDNLDIGQNATPLTTRTYVGRIIEQHKGAGKGVNLGNSGESGAFFQGPDGDTQAFSNARELTGYTFGTGGVLVAATTPDPYSGGNFVQQWNYGSAATWAYLAARGVQLVRLPFRAERIYRTFNAALDATEVGRIQTALGYAAANGIQVVLDCHNFGAYYLDNGSAGVAKALGGATFTNAIFADMWSRLTAAFDGYSAVVGYDLMNEPVSTSGGTFTWHTASQAALNAIRAAGSTKCVIVATDAGYNHPENVAGVTPWITDAANNFRYTAHCYFDYASLKDSSYGHQGTSGKGRYYMQLANCKTAGFTGTDSTPTNAAGGVTDSFLRPTPGGAWTTLGPTDDASGAYWRNSLTHGGVARSSDGSFDWYINTAGQATNFNVNQTVCFVKTGLSDGTVEVTLPTVGASGGGLWVRGADDGSTGIAVDIGGIYLTTRPTSGNCVFTSIATWTSPGYASGDKLRVTLAGTSITVQRIRAGVTTTLGSATSATYQTQTNHGLWVFAASTPRTAWSAFSVKP